MLSISTFYSNKTTTSLHVNLMARRVKRMMRRICEGSILFDDSAVLGFVCLLGVSDLVLWTQDSKCHLRFMYINGRDTMEDWVEGVRGSIW